jgi:hypothetical protein
MGLSAFAATPTSFEDSLGHRLFCLWAILFLFIKFFEKGKLSVFLFD